MISSKGSTAASVRKSEVVSVVNRFFFSEVVQTIGRPRRGWVDNTITNLEETDWGFGLD
jgi:hypothetical protein